MSPTSSKFIYKIVDAAHWLSAQNKTHLPPMAIDQADGYMHFSTASQLAKTLQLYFAGQKDVAILAIEIAALPVELKWEPSRGGDLFPHLYAPLPMQAIAHHQNVDVSDDGQCKLPDFVV